MDTGSFNLGAIVAHLKADTSDFMHGMEQAQRQTGVFHKGLGALAEGVKLAAIGIGIAGTAATAFGVVSVKAYEESERAQTQLRHAVVGVTHATEDQLKATENLATQLMKKGVLDDDTIKAGLAQLSTFGLSNNAVRNLGKSLADLTVNQFGVKASQEQASEAANMMARALRGQFGILERSGIRFTEAQKQIIKFGTEQEKVIAINQGFQQNLKYTNEVALTTTEGKLAHASVAFGNFKENIGKVITDGLIPLAMKGYDALSAIDWDRVIHNTVDGLKEFWDYLGRVWQAIDRVYQQIANYLEPKLGRLKDAIIEAYPSIKEFIEKYLMPLIEALAAVGGKSLVWAIGVAIDALTIFVKTLPGVINAFEHTYQMIKNTAYLITLAIFAIPQAFINSYQMIKNTAHLITEAIFGVARTIKSIFGDAYHLLYDVGKWIIWGLKDGMLSVLNSVKDGVGKVADSVKNGLKDLLGIHSPSTVFAEIGKNLTTGLVIGMDQGLPNIMDSVNRLGAGLANATSNVTTNLTTSITGPINISSEVDANNFLQRLTKNQEFAKKGLTPVR